MTPEETKNLLDQIVAGLNSAADYTGIIDKDLIPFIAIGKAVDLQIPGLVAAVQSWIEGNPPTDAEKADTAAKLATLADPNLP